MQSQGVIQRSANGLQLRLPNDPKLWLVLVAFCEKNIIRYIALVMSMIPGVSFFSSWLVPALYIVLILLCLQKVRTIGATELAVLVFTALAIIGTCVFYPQNAAYIFDKDQFWNVIFPCLRWFIVALVFVPNKENMELIGKVSCLSIVVEALFVVAYMIPNNLQVHDDMNRAYQLLPNILLVFNYAFNKRRFWPWFFSVIGAVYLLSLGTRGPIVVLLAFVFLKFLKDRRGKLWQKILLGVVLAGVGVVLVQSNIYVAILGMIKRFIAYLGMSTRVVDFAIEGTMLSNTTGRDYLAEKALEKIAERPLLGYGVYGEWSWANWNVHNLYLELLLHYGVVLGGALLLWILNLVRKAYFTSKNTYAQDVILIFFCFGLIRGFFGGSYLTFGMFFLIGFCIKEVRRTRHAKQKQAMGDKQ